MNHLWQRFLLASSLIVGLFIGVATTVFGYSNLANVDVHWSVLHVNGVPLWTVAVVPLAFLLIAGTLYHWMDGLHHFTEHMRHRRRVHELEAEVATLRAHLDQLLEMPDHSTSKLPDRIATTALPAAGNGINDVVSTEAPSNEDEPVQVVHPPAAGATCPATLRRRPTGALYRTYACHFRRGAASTTSSADATASAAL